MLGTFKPVAFEERRRRGRLRVPRWLVLLATGLTLGAAAVIYVQERHLPPRLPYEAAARLTERVQQLDAERQRLGAELAQAQQQLHSALADRQSLAEQLETSRRSVETLRADVATLVAALPPDPRGGAVAVRAARLRAGDQALAYEVLLTRDKPGPRALAGQLQFVVSGRTASGGDTTVTLPPVAVSIGTHHSASGELPLPRGFAPQQATLRITDGPGGALLGMRVLYVR